ncbi:glycosyl hydrolase family protein [Paenibacillus psychroresistens]|uniref:Glycosyl hydrolase family protein n=1 Tax=Paenibacillus psychroresistens TaxID=1778678 RepID=A0A6B8RU11_9BACL|nr:family 16 glycosylhydrolase [Paenibacillus psychroresistens]QGQ99407.1 glycosyl hydrolase family protein [Paenibacillus psychroresistens]
MVIKDKKTLVSLVLIMVMALSIFSVVDNKVANAAAVTSNTTDDATMWGTSLIGPTATTMGVNFAQDKRSYLKFSVSNPGTITTAVLNVKCITGGVANIGAYAGTGNTTWTQSNLAWNNQPALGALLSSKNMTFVAGTVYSFDVKPLITGNGTYSIILKGIAGNEVIFSTKEGTTIPNIVTNTGAATPTPTIAPTPTPTPAAGGPDLTGYTLFRDYSFGTSRNVNSLTSISNSFNPYGVAGTTVINNEWQRYQPINATNHHLTSTTLELTATPNLGGVYNGGISSGQITTKETFYPYDGKTYIFQLRAKIPKKVGAWPAFWLYSPGGAGSTNSEIDIFEFFDTPTQNTFDWTGYDHGDGVGADYYSIMTNQWVWHPGTDFAPDYHLYTLIWKEGNIQKWVDGTQVKGTLFRWDGPAPQVLINLAMGGNTNNSPVAGSFPAVFTLDYFRVYVK